MTDHQNPWADMGVLSKRRVVANSPHDVFWITDHVGRYGFLIVTKDSVLNTEDNLSLKGITVIKRMAERDTNEFFLVLNSNDDWSIFRVLCQDLVDVILNHVEHKQMISALENQLKRWQRLLQHRMSAFSVEQQMGLFTELMCLKEIVIPKTQSIADAVTAWGGPDHDRQDFLMSGAAIEVKSYRTSRGENVTISSGHQLSCDKEPFYLVSYGLTLTGAGLSVKDLSDELKQVCSSQELANHFESKLLQYGYVPELLTEPLQKFIVDSIKVFRVVNNFPRIILEDLNSQISSVKYTIDLSQCGEFAVNYDEFMSEVYA